MRYAVGVPKNRISACATRLVFSVTTKASTDDGIRELGDEPSTASYAGRSRLSAGARKRTVYHREHDEQPGAELFSHRLRLLVLWLSALA